MQVMHTFILLLFLLSISRQNGETMDEGIAYLGPIMMWLDLNGNGPSLRNTLMLSWVLPKT
jgi:hypothetical protein